MNYSEKACSSSIFSGTAYLNGVQKTDPTCALGTGGKKKILWTSYLIRNDFGMAAEKDEGIDRLPPFMKMA